MWRKTKVFINFRKSHYTTSEQQLLPHTTHYIVMRQVIEVNHIYPMHYTIYTHTHIYTYTIHTQYKATQPSDRSTILYHSIEHMIQLINNTLDNTHTHTILQCHYESTAHYLFNTGGIPTAGLFFIPSIISTAFSPYILYTQYAIIIHVYNTHMYTPV